MTVFLRYLYSHTFRCLFVLTIYMSIISPPPPPHIGVNNSSPLSRAFPDFFFPFKQNFPLALCFLFFLPQPCKYKCKHNVDPFFPFLFVNIECTNLNFLLFSHHDESPKVEIEYFYLLLLCGNLKYFA